MDSENDLLPEELTNEIRTRVFDRPGFIRLTQSLSRGGKTFRISLRPVTLRGQARFQAEMCDGGKTRVRNFDEAGARRGLDEILTQKGRRDFHLITADGDLHLRVTKKGKILTSRGKSAPAGESAEHPGGAHDRVKKHPLTAFPADALLKVIGIADGDGRIKPSMRGKYDQVNALLRCIAPMLPSEPPAAYTVVDCGCGKAYLTLALHQYLVHARGFRNLSVIGIVRNPDVIASARAMSEALGVADEVIFRDCTIDSAEFPEAPDIVMSLHACDTATDDALIAAVRHRAERILCVPCCQHELHHALVGGGPMRAPLRHGILRERLADLITDTFRAQVLRICGYRANVMEFVSGEATARNILIRAERTVRPAHGEAIAEYLDLAAFWGVTPYIGRALLDDSGAPR